VPENHPQFIAPMLLVRREKLPEGSDWIYEVKIDGYRAVAGRFGNQAMLRSRNDSDFTGTFPAIAVALNCLPDETMVDGELAVLDAKGRPSFALIQNHRSVEGTPVYFVFDLTMLRGRSLLNNTLDERKALLEKYVVPKLNGPLQYMAPIEGPLPTLIAAVKECGLEGLVAKRRNSRYESGMRTGSWLKMRVNRGQEFVIGGYTRGRETFDALVFGYYENRKLMYAARTRNGFTPESRAQLYRTFRSLEMKKCPFANLPEARAGRWGAGVTAEKMKDCQWLRPVLVGQFEFVEWTIDNHLRHARFIELRQDTKAKHVRREV
jgi:DNA ligase D-like protein (predicted ligase)